MTTLSPSSLRSPLILGCMHLGGSWGTDPLSSGAIQNTLECIRTALDGGITLFDHADIYCLGKSEEAFSHAWSELGLNRDAVELQSKCGIRRTGEPTSDAPHRFDFSYDHITTSVQKSLERLRTSYLDLLLLHRPDPLADLEDVARAFTDLRSQGLVTHFGVSNFNAAQIALLQSALSEPLRVNQLEFNLLQNDLLDEGATVNNIQQRHSYRGDGTLEYCRLHGITVQAYSPVARGQLTPAADNADERTKNAARILAEMARTKHISPETLLLAWILRHPAGIRPVIGSTKPTRISGMVQAPGVQLSREEWYTLYLAGRGRDLP